MAVFDPAFPSALVTPDAIFDDYVKTGVTWGFAVPFLVEVRSVCSLV